MGVFNVADYHPNGVRFPRVHAAGKLVGPVLQLFGGGQDPFAYVFTDRTIVAQGAGRLRLRNLGGFGDVGDCDVTATGSITTHNDLS